MIVLLSACPPAQLPPPSPEERCDGGGCPNQEVVCDAGTYLAAAGACHSAGWAQCPSGFSPNPGEWDCSPITSALDCPAGSQAQIGTLGCAPVGWSQCPAGFSQDSSGWGCVATLPSSPCTGATRESLGNGGCVSIGDCSAPFPPAPATLFVDDSYSAAQLDATHFTRITDALAAAVAGATIAIEAGTYSEALAPTRGVKLVGRCAAQVELSAPATTQPALAVIGTKAVELQGVTIRSSLLGARVEMGGQLTVRQSVFAANLRSGLQVLDPGTEVTLAETVVRDTVKDPATNSFGQGIAASFGARVTLTDVALIGNGETGLFLDRMGTRAKATRVVVAGTLPRASTGRLGWGIAVQGGAQLELDSAVVRDNRVTGLLVAQAPSKATVRESEISDTHPGKDNTGTEVAVNVSVFLGGTLDWTGGAIVRTAQTHLQVQASTAILRNVTLRGMMPALPASRAVLASEGAALTLEHSAIVDAVGSGLDAMDPATVVTLDHVAIEGTLPDPTRAGTGSGLRVQDQAKVTANQVVLSHGSSAGALALGGGQLTLTDCIVGGTRAGSGADGGEAGYGLVAQAGGVLTVARSLIEKNIGAGVYATGAASKAVLSQTLVQQTAFDSHGEFGMGAVAEAGARIELTEVGMVANHTAGLQVAMAGSQLAVLRSSVRGTLPNGTGTRGRGANSSFLGALTATESVFVDNQQVGIFAFQSRVELNDCLVQDTRADPGGKYGNGLESLTDGVILMTGGALLSNAGVGAVFAEGAGLLDSVRVGKQVVGVHVQDGSTLEELAAAPASVGARQVVVTPQTVFVDNQSRLGAGVVPVPPR
jgi:hypothetical protein